MKVFDTFDAFDYPKQREPYGSLKECNQCKQEKPESEFGWTSSTQQHRRTRCRKCAFKTVLERKLEEKVRGQRKRVKT